MSLFPKEKLKKKSYLQDTLMRLNSENKKSVEQKCKE